MSQRGHKGPPLWGTGTPLQGFPGGPACLQVMAHSGEAFCGPPVRGGRSRPPGVPMGGPPVPTWVIHTIPSVYLSHSLTRTGASASQQIPLPGPASLPDPGITGPELRGLSHPGVFLATPAKSCPLISVLPSACGAEQGAVLCLRVSRWSQGPAAGPVCPAPRPRADGSGASPSALGLRQPAPAELVVFLHFLLSKLGAERPRAMSAPQRAVCTRGAWPPGPFLASGGLRGRARSGCVRGRDLVLHPSEGELPCPVHGQWASTAPPPRALLWAAGLRALSGCVSAC